MKTKNIIVVLFVALLGIIGSCASVSAAKMGDPYQVMGIQAGWAIIGIAVIIAVFGYYVLEKKAMKSLTPIIVILLIIGVAMAFVDVTEETPAASVLSSTGFDIDVADPASGGSDIDDCAWDDGETVLTIPLEITGSGVLDGNRTHANFSLTPEAPDGAKSDEMVTIYFASDYLMKYGGEYVLEENSGIYFANWTYAKDGGTAHSDDYEGSISMLLTDTAWANVTWRFDSSTSDAFSAELDSIGDKVIWQVKFWTDGGWSQTYNIEAMVIET